MLIAFPNDVRGLSRCSIYHGVEIRQHHGHTSCAVAMTRFLMMISVNGWHDEFGRLTRFQTAHMLRNWFLNFSPIFTPPPLPRRIQHERSCKITLPLELWNTRPLISMITLYICGRANCEIESFNCKPLTNVKIKGAYIFLILYFRENTFCNCFVRNRGSGRWVDQYGLTNSRK